MSSGITTCTTLPGKPQMATCLLISSFLEKLPTQGETPFFIIIFFSWFVFASNGKFDVVIEFRLSEAWPGKQID